MFFKVQTNNAIFSCDVTCDVAKKLEIAPRCDHSSSTFASSHDEPHYVNTTSHRWPHGAIKSHHEKSHPHPCICTFRFSPHFQVGPLEAQSRRARSLIIPNRMLGYSNVTFTHDKFMWLRPVIIKDTPIQALTSGPGGAPRFCLLRNHLVGKG